MSNITVYGDYKLIAGTMPILDPNTPRENAKKLNHRIRAVFNANKTQLTTQHKENIAALTEGGKVLGRTQTAYMTFKRTVLNNLNALGPHGNLNDAIRMTFNATWFTPESVRGPKNLFTKIYNDKDTYKTFRKMVGWKQKIDFNKIKWNKELGAYVYDNRVFISIVQSPKDGVGQIGVQFSKLIDPTHNKWENQTVYYDRAEWNKLKTRL